MKRFDHVVDILDTAINHQTTIGAHGTFWRGKTLPQFIATKPFGRTLLVPGNSANSNIIKALRGLVSLRGGPQSAACRRGFRTHAGRRPAAGAG